MAVSLPTVSDVRAIVTTSKTDEQITVYINDAALIVEGCVSALDDARQASIVKYVAAHLIAATAGDGTSGAVITSKKLGDASESYARPTTIGKGWLSSSTYGAQAIALDPNGCLLRLGSRPVIMETL